MNTATLSTQEIGKLLDRQRRLLTIPDQIPLQELFEEILRIANQFVPSDAGSVLIDDPVLKIRRRDMPERSELIFVACFGEKAQQLLGQRIRADQGIVGKTYLTGESYISSDVEKDQNFCKQFDEEMNYKSESIICIPIKLGASNCGVLEMINRRGRPSFVKSDLDLLQIFAGYISTSLQNVLDANRYRELAKRDDLTGLYNDRYFNLRLTEEMDLAERERLPLSLIFIDLDHFKQVNDRHGHLVGSQTLRQVGSVFSSCVTQGRDIVARYGGDEFVIIIPGAGLEEGIRIGEDIRRRVERSVLIIDIGAEEIPPVRIQGVITASVGVASYWESHFTSKDMVVRKNEFIRFADQAMYVAKASGKNRVCHNEVPQRASTT